MLTTDRFLQWQGIQAERTAVFSAFPDSRGTAPPTPHDTLPSITPHTLAGGTAPAPPMPPTLAKETAPAASAGAPVEEEFFLHDDVFDTGNSNPQDSALTLAASALAQSAPAIKHAGSSLHSKLSLLTLSAI